MNEESVYHVALARVFAGHFIMQRQLIEHFGTARKVYENRHNMAEVFPNMGENLRKAVAGFDKQLEEAQKAVRLVTDKGGTCLCMVDDAYPKRLNECCDAPIVLFYKGTADLNAAHIVSIVGTRQCTEYGRTMTGRIVTELANHVPDLLIISGLAYGIDIAAQRCASQLGVNTVAVLAHGLERIYPGEHWGDAQRMLEKGGLVTEYEIDAQIVKSNFIARNRIVAGMSDVTIVVESKSKGGSLITARLANDYNRAVFAVPGRATDESSLGCLHLIHDNKAALLMSPKDFLVDMEWQSKEDMPKPLQREIFPQLDELQTKIVNAIKASEGGIHIDQLIVATGKLIKELNNSLFELEMDGVIRKAPGGLYFLN